jgi:hypothetical protein
MIKGDCRGKKEGKKNTHTHTCRNIELISSGNKFTN